MPGIEHSDSHHFNWVIESHLSFNLFRTIESRDLVRPYHHDVYTLEQQPASLSVFEHYIYWTAVGSNDDNIGNDNSKNENNNSQRDFDNKSKDDNYNDAGSEENIKNSNRVMWINILNGHRGTEVLGDSSLSPLKYVAVVNQVLQPNGK